MFNDYTELGAPINLVVVPSQSDCTVVRLSWTTPEPNGNNSTFIVIIFYDAK